MRSDRVVTSVATWKQVGLWLEDHASLGDARTTTTALARDLHSFLKEQGLMTKYPTSRDLAAALMFARSFEPLEAMFDDTIEIVAAAFPKHSTGRRLHTEFWSEGNVFWAYFHFAKTIRRRPTLPYLAVGICFELSGPWAADAAILPADEPFVFVYCADDHQKKKAGTLFTATPRGWNLIDDGYGVIAFRTLASLPTGPDARVLAIQDWAKGEIGRLVVCIPDYAEAPAGPAAKKVETSED